QLSASPMGGVFIDRAVNNSTSSFFSSSLAFPLATFPHRPPFMAFFITWLMVNFGFLSPPPAAFSLPTPPKKASATAVTTTANTNRITSPQLLGMETCAPRHPHRGDPEQRPSPRTRQRTAHFLQTAAGRNKQNLVRAQKGRRCPRIGLRRAMGYSM